MHFLKILFKTAGAVSKGNSNAAGSTHPHLPRVFVVLLNCGY